VILFDTEPGELFVVRVAGNVANPSSIAIMATFYTTMKGQPHAINQ